MKSRTTERFRRAYAALPLHVRRQARIAYRTFRLDPAHPGLHFKKIHARRQIYSARVGLGYRALAIIEGDTAVWFWVGSHNDYDRVIAAL